MTEITRTKEDIIGEAKDLVNAVTDRLPFAVVEVTNPDQDDVIARINGSNGYPVIMPNPESESLMRGKRSIFQLFVFAPRIIRELLDIIESESAKKVTPKE